MKKFIYLSTMTVSLWGCDQSIILGQKNQRSTTDTVTKPGMDHPQNSIHPGNLFMLSDAEKILGEKAHLTDSSSTIKGDISTYSCAYFANTKDSESEKTGCIYFMFQTYPQISSAQEIYSFYKKANESNPGVKELNDMGDEAWFQSSPLFVYVRKGDKIFDLKVNKRTSKTSSDEFNLVAKKITDAL